MRKYRYNAAELQRTDKDGLYFTGSTGVNWNAIIAFFVGMVCSTIAFSKAPPPVNFPFHWMTPFSNHYGGALCGQSRSRRLQRRLVRRRGLLGADRHHCRCAGLLRVGEVHR